MPLRKEVKQMSLIKILVSVKAILKALSVGSQILACIEALVKEGIECSGKEVELYPIHLRKGGRKWTISVVVRCEDA